jgi:hypothetical protein
MDTQQPELSVEQKGNESVTVERVLIANDVNGEAVKVEKISKDHVTIIPTAVVTAQQQHQQQPPQLHPLHPHHHQSSSPPVTVHEAIVTSAPPHSGTVIATRQRMITTQGHIREIAVGQQDVPEHYEQFQITASGDGQNVYTYEQSPSGIITINQPENLLKRDILIAEKEHPTISVVNAEPQTVYVELKNNNNDEQTRYLPNATIRYAETPERYHHHHRIAYHGLPSHNPHLQREVTLKSENPPQELQIYEAEHQQQQQQGEQSSIQSDQQSNETKVHYTNLETVGSSQSSYYITSESYQPTNSNGFTYLPTSTSKEGPYIYHPSASPVLYKGRY